MKIRLFDNDQHAETVAAGTTLFQVGDRGDEMFAVISGEVEILIRGTVVATMGPGEVFGEMALIEDLPRAASAVVKSEAKLVRVDKKRFLFLVQQNPFFALQLMTIMADRLRRMGEKL